MTYSIATSVPGVNAAAQPEGSARHAKLVRAAQEFEGVMLEELLKPLSKGSSIGGEDEDGGTAGPLQGFGVQAMATSLAKSGALGFAARISRAVEKHDTKYTSNNML